MKLMKVCWLGSLYIISPMARMSRNMIRPTPMYTRMMLGPVSAIDLPEPRNRPVPMVPPMAMNWTWRFFRPRSMSLSLSRLSMDLICAVSVASDVLVPVFPVFVFPKVIMFTPYRVNRTISAVVRTAKCAICGRFASFPKKRFATGGVSLPRFSACHGAIRFRVPAR